MAVNSMVIALYSMMQMYIGEFLRHCNTGSVGSSEANPLLFKAHSITLFPYSLLLPLFASSIHRF
uniref:Uncharacterized protein n=1 Tax=Solanum lycopersicum TaxID=4081 RepID=A0A3Q7I302_SOLLC